MNQNDKYIDIYSHSLVNNKPNKSRGSLKNVLCFFILLILIAIIVLSYCLGALIAKKSINTKQTVNQSIKETVQSNFEAFAPELSNALDCVVGIYIYNDKNDNYATGTIVSSDGYIVTNDHVFAGVESPRIVVFDKDKRYFKAAFIGGDSKFDLAVIKIETASLNCADLNDMVLPELGMRVYSVGCPINESLSFSVTSGVISGVNRRIRTNESIYPSKLIQTDASINPGSSGGPLLNSRGQVVGINCLKMVDESLEGLGFAIPLEIVNPIVNDIIEFGEVKNRAQLGISYSCNEYTQSLSNGTTCGIVINNIKPLSDLNGKGIESGDIIIMINGKRIFRESDFLDEIEACSIDDEVRLTVSSKDGAQFEVVSRLITEKSKTSYIG